MCQDHAWLLEADSNDYKDLNSTAQHLNHPNGIHVWDRYPTELVGLPIETPNREPRCVVDCMSGQVTSSQTVVWIDLGEHVDMKAVRTVQCNIPHPHHHMLRTNG